MGVVCQVIRGRGQLKRSPTEGRGAREPCELVGSLERSGSRPSLRVSSSFTPVTLSSLVW